MEKLLIIIYFFNFLIILSFISSNDFLVTPLLKKIIPSILYQKFSIDYNLIIKLYKDVNETIDKELFINASNIPNDNLYDFYYKGKLINLNVINLNRFPSKYYINKTLLIRSNYIFNKYITKYKPIIKNLSKVIFIRKNTISNYSIIAKNYIKDLSLLVLELNETIFNILEVFGENNDIEVLSKQLDILPYKFLYIISRIIITLTISFSLFYECLIRSLFNNNKNTIQDKIIKHLIFKYIILNFLLFELNTLYTQEGIYIRRTLFWNIFIKLLMAINRYILIFFDDVYNGLGINFKVQRNYYYFVIYIVFYFLINPLKSPLSILINIIFLIPFFSRMTYSSIKNIIYLSKVNSKIYTNKIKYKIYAPVIKLKLYIVITQLIILFIISYLYLCINKYFLYKKEFNLMIEKDILFQSLESFLLILIAIIYIPRKMPKGFNLHILIMKDLKSVLKIKSLIKDNYTSSMNKITLNNEENFQKYIDNNLNKEFIILNPKSFFNKDKNNNKEDGNNQFIIDKSIKIGKL